jgi:Fe-S-cluster containining protein
MDNKEFNGMKNIKIVDGKKVFNCVQCGECCHIREKDKGISDEDEEKYRAYMFSKFGIIYLANLSDITINVWPEEADRIKDAAKKRKIHLKMMPKRAVYDNKGHELIILDYFIDHDICPFFDEKKRLCGIYDDRPSICRSYPLLTTKNLGKCIYKIPDVNAYANEKIEAEKLEKMIRKQKDVIASLIADEKIVVPKTITHEEMDDIIKTAKFKELRVMDKA